MKPEALFELPEYKSTGALFWPDIKCGPPMLFYDLLDMGFISIDQMPTMQTESGQWLLDRRKHREALEYILLLGTHDDYTFKRVNGDKVSSHT